MNLAYGPPFVRRQLKQRPLRGPGREKNENVTTEGEPNFLYSVSGRFWEEGVKPIENNGQDAALWTQMSFIFN